MVDLGRGRIAPHSALPQVEERDIVAFSVDGREFYGYAGEPLALALLAHGIRKLHTNPVSGAPRGYFCGVGRCSDCLMTVDGELGVPACITPLRSGMVVRTQVGLGSWDEAS